MTQKGTDSTIAIVHIDGNNMGARIRRMVQGTENYEEAVNKMRNISYQINTSYKRTFEKMQDHFNRHAGKHQTFQHKVTDDFVLKVLVAGDDITYVCNGKIALATVEFYCREITKHTMTGKADRKSPRQDGFSVCAGIAYMNSHFPFYAGYEVAEACCSSAKSFAKAWAKEQERQKEERTIGNWVDYQICQNIQAQDLETMREREYKTRSGEYLLERPYFIHTGGVQQGLEPQKDSIHSLDRLKEKISYLQDETNLPRSFAKKLQSQYAQGQLRAELWEAFLASRNWDLPDKSSKLYKLDDENKNRAEWYDALELMDYYVEMEAGDDA